MFDCITENFSRTTSNFKFNAMAPSQELQDERRACSFDPMLLAYELYEGKQAVERRQQIFDFVASTPELNDQPVPREMMSREQRLENSARKLDALLKNQHKIDVQFGSEEFGLYAKAIFQDDGDPIYLHRSMFIPALKRMATEAQQAAWLPQAEAIGCIGTYAQTELGHGTTIRELETQAVYDKAAQQFVLRTPTITAYKCWPGNLGKNSNVAIVVAQLIINGKSYGPHFFYVPLRDPVTHAPLPGIDIGDMGPKLGLTGIDNGFLALNDVRIPRENLLMKNSQVLADGTYVKPPSTRLDHAAMMHVRSYMVRSFAEYLAMAATIATRYSCVRRQGHIEPADGREVQLMVYGSQQQRVLYPLATAFAYWFTGLKMRALYEQSMGMSTEQLVAVLPDLHAILAGVKATVTWDVVRGIEQCRLACGGHGYAHYSGIPALYTNSVAGCTYEGDNLVMLLQVAKALIKAFHTHSQSSYTAYLTEELPAPTLNGNDDLSAYVCWQRRVAQQLVKQTAGLLRATAATSNERQAWAAHGVALTKAARAHTRIFVTESLVEAAGAVRDAGVRTALGTVARVYVLNQLLERADKFIEAGLPVSCLPALREALRLNLLAMRKEAVGLTDSFVFTDAYLNSSLGRHDGDVYPSILQWFRSNPLNQTQVLDYHTKYLAPMLAEARAKL